MVDRRSILKAIDYTPMVEDPGMYREISLFKHEGKYRAVDETTDVTGETPAEALRRFAEAEFDQTMTDRKPIHNPNSSKIDTDLNVAGLLRQVANELEEHNDSKAMSLMGRARLKRLVNDLEGARALRHADFRTDSTKEMANGSYLIDDE